MKICNMGEHVNLKLSCISKNINNWKHMQTRIEIVTCTFLRPSPEICPRSLPLGPTIANVGHELMPSFCQRYISPSLTTYKGYKWKIKRHRLYYESDLRWQPKATRSMKNLSPFVTMVKRQHPFSIIVKKSRQIVMYRQHSID